RALDGDRQRRSVHTDSGDVARRDAARRRPRQAEDLHLARHDRSRDADRPHEPEVRAALEESRLRRHVPRIRGTPPAAARHRTGSDGMVFKVRAERAPLVAVILLLAASPAAAQTFAIDPSTSTATIAVGKAGLFSFAAGHVHEVRGPIGSGTVALDANDAPRIDLVIPARGLQVMAKGEPPADVP